MSPTKPHSTKRTLHIFDSIQSIFQTNNHNHSFNERHHHNHDKKHKHNHTLENPSAKHNSHRHTDSHKIKKDTTTDTKKKQTTIDTNSTNNLEADTASKMQNVTRILINATNPKQSNGNYECSYAY